MGGFVVWGGDSETADSRLGRSKQQELFEQGSKP